MISYIHCLWEFYRIYTTSAHGAYGNGNGVIRLRGQNVKIQGDDDVERPHSKNYLLKMHFSNENMTVEGWPSKTTLFF